MIHPTAIIDQKSKISKDVVLVLLYNWPDVELGSNTKLHSHVSINGNTKIGKIMKYFLLYQLEHLHKI